MRITSQNLDQTIELNQKIKREVHEHIKFMERYLRKLRIYSPEKQALQILKEHNLIRVLVPDSDWGGAIYELPSGNKVPIINTAQSRLYQYFICWHEVYHLTETSNANGTHNITTEFDLTERKADYFASQMLISEDVYEYYYQLKFKDFIDCIACCMDMFKAPYKAILIQLYELAMLFDNAPLQQSIKEHFDIKLDQITWEKKFLQLSLDETLVKPTYVVDFGRLKDLILEKSEMHSDVELYSEHRNFLLNLEKKLLAIKDELSIG